jgi:hypothetical protein
MIEQFARRVGDPRTPEGVAFLTERSPLTQVAKIKKPLLIGQGANDPRVKQAESDQIVSAMQERNIPVTYVLFPDEGHGFARPENSMAFNAVVEAFLSQHLGGRAEPIGDDPDQEHRADPAPAPRALPALPTPSRRLPRPAARSDPLCAHRFPRASARAGARVVFVWGPPAGSRPARLYTGARTCDNTRTWRLPRAAR